MRDNNLTGFRNASMIFGRRLSLILFEISSYHGRFMALRLHEETVDLP